MGAVTGVVIGRPQIAELTLDVLLEVVARVRADEAIVELTPILGKGGSQSAAALCTVDSLLANSAADSGFSRDERLAQ